jgi:pimeloyl-ACP methyl ester carboxylesterase
MANGIEINYELTGEGGHTIAWTHGIGSSLEYWQDDLSHFPTFRHLTYDVRGMGQSERLEGPVSLELWAQDLAALLGALEIRRAIIAGSSMGGAITQRFGIDFPELTEGLLILSTSSRVGPAAEESWMKRADETERTDRYLAAAQRAVASYNMDEELTGIRVPALVLCGDQDQTTPAGGSVIISRCIPDAELEIYEGVGHAPFHEEPRSVERAKEWLAQFS